MLVFDTKALTILAALVGVTFTVLAAQPSGKSLTSKLDKEKKTEVLFTVTDPLHATSLTILPCPTDPDTSM